MVSFVVLVACVDASLGEIGIVNKGLGGLCVVLMNGWNCGSVESLMSWS
jgi:hypothetical protein